MTVKRIGIAVLGLALATVSAVQASAQIKPAGAKEKSQAPRAMQAAGSRLVLDLAPGFKVAPRFVGFFDEQRNISIVASELPVSAFAELEIGMTPDALKARGFIEPRMAVIARSDQHIYIRAAQTSPVGLMDKFILVFAADDATVNLAINVPTQSLTSGIVKEAEFEAILKTARLIGRKKTMPLMATLTDTASLKAALVHGQTQMWTTDGKLGTPGATSPSIILAGSIDFNPLDRPGQRAAAMLSGLAGYRNIAFVGAAQQIKRGDYNGYELVASAEDEKTGSAHVLYQYLLPLKGGGYVRYLGVAPAGDKDLWLASFRASVATMRLTK